MIDRNYIEQLFKAHFVQMHRFAVMLLHDEELAADVVQDVFASLLESEANSSVSGGYLMNAVRNRCLNHIRDCEIHQRIIAGYYLDSESEQYIPFDDERMSNIRTLVSSELPPQARRIIELRFYSGLQFSEIAVEMGISETAVYRHLRKALILIRQKLNTNGN